MPLTRTLFQEGCGLLFVHTKCAQFVVGSETVNRARGTNCIRRRRSATSETDVESERGTFWDRSVIRFLWNFEPSVAWYWCQFTCVILEIVFMQFCVDVLCCFRNQLVVGIDLLSFYVYDWTSKITHYWPQIVLKASDFESMIFCWMTFHRKDIWLGGHLVESTFRWMDISLNGHFVENQNNSRMNKRNENP